MKCWIVSTRLRCCCAIASSCASDDDAEPTMNANMKTPHAEKKTVKKASVSVNG